MVLFQVLTGMAVRWRWLLPGAAVGALGWSVLQSVGVTIVNRQLEQANLVYGVFAVVIVLLGWLYLSSQLVLYAAEINVVLARRLWPRSMLQPPLTEPDRQVLTALAQTEERRPEQRVQVTFLPEADDADDRSSRPTATGPTGVTERQVPGPRRGRAGRLGGPAGLERGHQPGGPVAGLRAGQPGRGRVVALAAARRRRVSAADLGLGRDRAARGLRVGLAATVPVVAVVAAGAALPATRRFFLDERATTGGTGYALYHTLVRIPLGTAVAEETLFRGSLLGLLLPAPLPGPGGGRQLGPVRLLARPADPGHPAP